MAARILIRAGRRQQLHDTMPALIHRLLRWPRAVSRILRRANNLIVYSILFLGYAAARIIKEGRLFKL